MSLSGLSGFVGSVALGSPIGFSSKYVFCKWFRKKKYF